MPRIDVNAEGTGFVVGYPAHREDLGNFHHYYIVTNYHVLKHAPVARLNKNDGSTDTAGVDICDWELNEAADIGALPLRIKYGEYKIHFIGAGMFLTPGDIDRYDIGVGDDVFMIGYLVDHPESTPLNQPYVRFGHISKMTTQKSNTPYSRNDGFRLDMRSRVGFSGSPVFVYRNPFSNMKMGINFGLTVDTDFFSFLGIHWGGLPELWELDDRKVQSRGMSEMTVANPAWEIRKILERDVLVKQRDEYGKEMFP